MQAEALLFYLSIVVAICFTGLGFILESRTSGGSISRIATSLMVMGVIAAGLSAIFAVYYSSNHHIALGDS